MGWRLGHDKGNQNGLKIFFFLEIVSELICGNFWVHRRRTSGVHSAFERSHTILWAMLTMF
jgi:hypothetical protein